MLTDHERSLAVQSLRTAHVTKEPCVQLSTRFPNIEIEDSYAISSALAQERIRRGAKVIGHKIGLTSKALQASSGIDEPDYRYLFDDMILPDVAKVKHADFCVPRVEPELTFILKSARTTP
jgi:2-oxo-hept-3-ene-1,7-dioate hydratase